MKPMNLGSLPSAEKYTWQIGTEQNPISGGINITDLEYMLSDNQSPHMLNMWYDGRVLGKRPGQRTVVANMPEDVVAITRFDDEIIAATNAVLYKIHMDGTAHTELKAGLEGAGKGTFFTFGGRLYFLNGKNYIVYDGTTAAEVEPYCPIITINRPPNGMGGDLTDNYNRLGGWFTNSFSADGTSKEYILTDKALDADKVKVVVGGTEMKTGFAVDYVNGKVTFAEPPTKGTNNVEISVSKLDADMRNNLLSCTQTAVFGGENGTRVFFAGNGTATYYYSDVTSPDYFPENNYNVVGDNEPVTALAQQYGVLIVFKEREVWQVSYSFDGVNARFPLKAVNRTVGCDAPGSIQMINNTLVWLHSKRGVYILQSTSIQDERNVQKISRNIDGNYDRPGLLACNGLKESVSVDWRGKYFLCVDGKAWVWDYEISPYQMSSNPDLSAKMLSWFLFDNIKAKAFVDCSALVPVSMGMGYLRDNSLTVFDDQYRDYGLGYRSFWRMPIRNFNIDSRLKSVLEMWVTVRTDTNTKIKVKYVTEQNNSGEEDDEPILASSFSWRGFAWDTFTWNVMNFAKTYRRKPKKKKISYFALEFECSDAGRDMNISGITLTWRPAKKVK